MAGVDVRYVWNGEPAPLYERATLWLSASPEGLVIDVDAPHFGDPLPDSPPGPVDGLWEHEVVELFVVGADGRYTEVELGPGGHHLVLQLRGVRDPVARCLPIRFEAAIADNRWTGAAVVPWELLPEGPHRVAGFAIHGVGEGRRYLSSVPLPGPKPDFHQPDRFPAFPLPSR